MYKKYVRSITRLGWFDLNFVNGRDGPVVRMGQLVERVVKHTTTYFASTPCQNSILNKNNEKIT